MATTDEDEDIRLRLVAGSDSDVSDAFVLIDKQYRVPICSWVRKNYYPGMSVEDLAEMWQDTMTELLTKVRDGKYAGEQRVFSDLCQIISRNTIDLRRKHRTRERVRYIPKTLEPGVLYVSEEFGAAIHLCACGCGSKVSTPIGPTDWTLEDAPVGPTLTPSVGNWQLPCKSHYWIRAGSIIWASMWTPGQILAGRRAEEGRHRAYFEARARLSGGVLKRIWRWIMSLFA